MNKKLKIALIIVITIFIIIIILDTIQSRIFKHSPMISFEEKLEDSDSFVDRGILIDTYYCTKERDIITVYYEFKTSKFTCPIE